ncbi:MAG: hypothetical protein KDA72_13045, partial [Planctomycetales bacterium]|nr:hypothetical protein [Planctomycetales bacterium]
EFSDDPKSPHTVADLSAVYKGQADSVRRSVTLLPSREVRIEDSLTGLTPGSHVRWGMITRAEVGAGADATLRLQLQAQRLTLTIAEPLGATWATVNTEKPRHEWDSANPGTTMVAFEVVAPEDGKLRLVVVATPGSRDQ